jgi:arabinogalactan endo-1,4-beta-galactosidase
MSLRRSRASGLVLVASAFLLHCSNAEAPAPIAGSGGSGGSAGSGGSGGSTAGTGGASSGASGTGGVTAAGAGGTPAAGGGAGGAENGGALGAGDGGASASGGVGASGAGTGGTGGAGGAGVGGKGGAAPLGPFMIGADISQVEEQEDSGSTWVDDGMQMDMLALLRGRGFNWIRLRAFVDPRAQGGYSSDGYCDTEHTVTMGARVKQAGMSFLLDLHYSDYWADPGKQIKPLAWRDISSIGELATQVRTYTRETVEALVNGGARPDMVAIGNEITPGMLLHVPDDPSDPDGALTVTMPNGSIDDWASLGMLLKAGVAGVHDIDPSIKIMLHTDRGGSADASVSFVENALEQGVPFDTYAVSCYAEYQGGPSACSETLNAVIEATPGATFGLVIGEYAVDTTSQASIVDSIRGTNDAVWELPEERGAGTFFWEPTRSGAWGEGLFTWAGNTGTAVGASMDLYEAMAGEFVR